MILHVDMDVFYSSVADGIGQFSRIAMLPEISLVRDHAENLQRLGLDQAWR